MKKKFLIAGMIILCMLTAGIPRTGAAADTPSSVKRARFEKTGHVFWDIPVDEKLVALTFDDGPDPNYTAQILDILAKYNAKATFFVIGEEAARYPELVKRQAREGHEIANHTYRHHFRDGHSPAVLKRELEKSEKIIKELTGYSPSLFRPIAGYYDEEIVDTAVSSGYNVILWSWHQETRDWSRPGANKIVQNVVSDARPGDVIIFHDAGGDRSQTVKALDSILKILSENGYKFVTVSELLYQANSFLPASLR